MPKFDVFAKIYVSTEVEANDEATAMHIVSTLQRAYENGFIEELEQSAKEAIEVGNIEFYKVKQQAKTSKPTTESHSSALPSPKLNKEPCVFYKRLDECHCNNDPDDPGECIYENGIESGIESVTCSHHFNK